MQQDSKQSNLKITLMVLAAVGLALNVLGVILQRVSLSVGFSMHPILGFLGNLFFLIMFVPACVFLLIAVLKFKTGHNIKVWSVLTMVTFPLGLLLYLIYQMSEMPASFNGVVSWYSQSALPVLMLVIFLFVIYIISIIHTVLGWKNKIFVAIGLGTVTFIEFSYLIYLVVLCGARNFGMYWLINIFIDGVMSIGIILFCVTLFILIFNYKYTQNTETAVNYFNLAPQVALQVLYNDLCNEKITSEQYRQIRQQIINKM